MYTCSNIILQCLSSETSNQEGNTNSYPTIIIAYVMVQLPEAPSCVGTPQELRHLCWIDRAHTLIKRVLYCIPYIILYVHAHACVKVCLTYVWHLRGFVVYHVTAEAVWVLNYTCVAFFVSEPEHMYMQFFFTSLHMKGFMVGISMHVRTCNCILVPEAIR